MERELVLEFVLGDSELISPNEFEAFFGLGSEIVRELVLGEAVEAYDAGGVEGPSQFDSTDQLQRLLKSAPVPAEVVDVRHSSPWLYVLHLPAVLVAAFVTKCLVPEIKRAWKGSVREKQFYDFFRNQLFGGAKSKLEKSVARTRRRPRQGIRPVEVRTLPNATDRSQRFLIRVERTQNLEVVVTDEELYDDLRKRLEK